MVAVNTEYNYNKKSSLTENELAEVFRRAADASQKEPVLKLDYDKKGNLTEIVRTDASGKAAVTQKIKYNSQNMPVSSSNGQSSNTLEYNGYSYPLSVSDSFKLTKRLEYNRFNQLIASTDAFGVKTQYTFTPAGLISQIERRDGADVLSSLSIAYNSKGQPVSYTDQQGRVKKFERDAFGRVVKEFFPDESSVEYSYNAAGQLAAVLDQNKNEIKFDWDKFGLGSKTTAADQLTDYAYDKFGMLKSVASSRNGKTDRDIKYEYDKFKRVSKITYGTGEMSTFKYDTWGKLIASTSGKKNATFKYDYFGRMIEKTEDGIVNTYIYNEYGQRTSRVTKNASLTLDEHKTYDKFGRLSQIKSGAKTITYTYNSKNQLVTQNINGVPVEFSYTKYGQLDSKVLGGKLNPISSLAYSYTKDGMISARLVNGVMQNFEYDAKGQLLKVVDLSGKAVEEYVYDPAGNILKKTVDGKTTMFTYDKANQLASSTLPDGTVKKYVYDAAGRLVTESDAAGAKEYSYGWLDKVTELIDNGKKTEFSYYTSGQLESRVSGSEKENFLWDGLALIKRNDVDYINEPYVTGGNPILANDKVMFNDMLGTTLGVKDGEKFTAIEKDAFGAGNVDGFFTGKPYVEGLGYSFLFRNYRPEIGKWQTADPAGYPDGWNNLAYCNNDSVNNIDLLGLLQVVVVDGNNNDTAVTSANGLTVGTCSTGGIFNIGTIAISKDTNGGLVITISVTLNIANYAHSADVAQGTITEYKPHSTSTDDAYMINKFHEAVLGHEKGHASNFFSNILSLFTAAIIALNIDETKSVEEIDNSYDFVTMYHTADAATLSTDISLANAGTYGAFDSTWRQLSEENGKKRWMKE